MSAALSLVPPLTLPPVRCAPWCSEGRGHTGASFPDDQYCSSDVPDDVMVIGNGGGELNVGLVAKPGQPVAVEICVISDRHSSYAAVPVEIARRYALAILATCDLEDSITRDGVA